MTIRQDRLHEYSLRRAIEDDVPALVELARRSWLSAFDGVAPPALVAYWKAADRAPAWYARYWPSMTVAERDGAIVGVMQPLEDEINGLWVDPAAQGSGIGSALLRAGEREIASAGYKRTWLTCSALNLRALRFYAWAGYTETSRRTHELAPNLSDEVVILERRLEITQGQA